MNTRKRISIVFFVLLLVLVTYQFRPGVEAIPLSAGNGGLAKPGVLSYVANRAATGIEVVGIGIIVLGAVVASVFFLREWFGQRTFLVAYQRYRERLGQAILLGLEFLVAADIIGTVAVHPTFRNVGILGVIVAIRTFLSFALEVEVKGQWPWQGKSRESP